MFDLAVFIAQLLPAHRRTPLLVALTRILFAPALPIMARVAANRKRLLTESQATGQVLALEEMLRRQCLLNPHLPAGYVVADSAIPDSWDVDVIYPDSSNVDDNGKVYAIMERYLMAGKHWRNVTEVVTPTAPLAWAIGLPYRSGNVLYWAINKVGDYPVTVKQGSTILLNETQSFLGSDIYRELTVDPTKAYTVTVGDLTATVPGGGVPTVVPISAGRDWIPGFFRTLNIGVNANAAPTITLTGPVAITRTLDEFETTLAGQLYLYRFVGESMPDGLYSIHIEDGVDTFDGTFELKSSTAGQAPIAEVVPGGGGGNSNQPPVVASPLADLSAVVGTAFSFGISTSTFTDADGTIATVAVSGLPAGLSFDPVTRVISGTPTTAGASTVTVTATDDDGATVGDSLVLTVSVAPSGGGAVGTLDAAAGTRPVYAGTIDWPNSYQSNTNFLDVEVVEVRADGFVRFNNKATGKNPTNGRSLIYTVENEYVDDIGGKFYSPDYPPLFMCFWVDHSVPRYAWQSWEFVQYSDFYKATSRIALQ